MQEGTAPNLLFVGVRRLAPHAHCGLVHTRCPDNRPRLTSVTSDYLKFATRQCAGPAHAPEAASTSEDAAKGVRSNRVKQPNLCCIFAMYVMMERSQPRQANRLDLPSTEASRSYQFKLILQYA